MGPTMNNFSHQPLITQFNGEKGYKKKKYVLINASTDSTPRPRIVFFATSVDRYQIVWYNTVLIIWISPTISAKLKIKLLQYNITENTNKNISNEEVKILKEEIENLKQHIKNLEQLLSDKDIIIRTQNKIIEDKDKYLSYRNHHF